MWCKPPDTIGGSGGGVSGISTNPRLALDLESPVTQDPGAVAPPAPRDPAAPPPPPGCQRKRKEHAEDESQHDPKVIR